MAANIDVLTCDEWNIKDLFVYYHAYRIPHNISQKRRIIYRNCTSNFPPPYILRNGPSWFLLEGDYYFSIDQSYRIHRHRKCHRHLLFKRILSELKPIRGQIRALKIAPFGESCER